MLTQQPTVSNFAGKRSTQAGFSLRAHKAIISAQIEAIALGHDSIAPEHLLLGLLRDSSCTAIRVVKSLGGDVHAIARSLRTKLKPGQPVAENANLEFAPRTKRVVNYALAEALLRGRREIGTELILLGLLIEKHSIVARTLHRASLRQNAVRRETARQLGLRTEELQPQARASSAPEPRTSAQVETLLASCHGNHVPPLSNMGRWLQRVLLWTSVPLVLAGLSGVYLSVDNSMFRIAGLPLFFLLALLPCFGWLLFVASFRLQAHINELMITLPVCSLPLGVALNTGSHDDVVCWSAGIIGGLLMAAGSVWGLSVLQRSGEKRTWQRLALLALGWAASLGAPACALLIADLTGTSHVFTSIGHHLLAAALIATVAPAVYLEFRCSRRFGPLRIW